MGVIEAILLGVQFKRLEKPVIFLAMLCGVLIFGVFGFATLLLGVTAVLEGKAVGPGVGLASMSIPLFGLVAVCAHFIKKCVR